MLSKRLVVIFSILLMFLMLAGCGGTANPDDTGNLPANEGGTTTEPGGSGTPGGGATERSRVLNLGTDVKATSLDANGFRDAGSQYSIGMCYEALIYTDHTGQGYTPMLAESWDIAEDGMSWTFHLRQGVKFHNGEDFDADDVVTTVQRCIDGRDELAFTIQYLPTLASVEKIDQYTVKVGFSAPTPLAGNGFRALYIIPADAFAEHGTDLFFGQPPLMYGTGPWKMKEWIDGQYVSYVKNEDYWNKAEYDPFFEEVYIRYIAEPSSAIAGHLAGTTECYIRQSGVPVDMLSLYEGSEDRIEIVNYNTNSTAWFGLSFKEGSVWLDENIRKAFDAAIDRQGIIDNVINGAGSVPTGYVHSSVIGYDESLGHPVYDPELARQLLADSSYDGRPITLTVNGTTTELEAIYLALADMVNQVGFNLEVEFVDISVFTPKQNSGDYDMFTLSTSIGDGIPQRQLSRIPNNFDKANYNNEALNAAINGFLTDIDADQRYEYARQANQMIFEDKAPHISFFHRDFFQAINYGITGIRLFPDGMYDFAYVDYDPSLIP